MNGPERFLVDRHCLLYDNKLMNNVLTLLNCDTGYGSTVHIILHLRD